jgi:hypothetical protein
VLWVQSPTGMPATHGSCVVGSPGTSPTCVGLVQSEAGIAATHKCMVQGLGIEPRIFWFRARRLANSTIPELTGRSLTSRTLQARFWRPSTARQATYKWRRADYSKAMAVPPSGFQPCATPWSLHSPFWRKAENSNLMLEGTICFRGSAVPCTIHLPKWRMPVGHDPHTREGTSRVQAGDAPRALQHP